MDFKSYFKKILMLEAVMTNWEAAQIFGFTDGKIPQASELRKIYLKKIQNAHPDAGGKTEDAASINAAYDLLKKCAGSTVSSYSSSSSYGGWNRSRYSYNSGGSSYSSSSSSSSNSRNSGNQGTTNEHLKDTCKKLEAYAEKFDKDFRAEFANKLGAIAKTLDAKTGYNWSVKFLVKERLAPLMKNCTAFDELYYNIYNFYVVKPSIHANVVFENNDPNNKCKVYADFSYKLNITKFMKKWAEDAGMRNKGLFNGDFTYEGTISFQNQSRLLKKEYSVSGKNRWGSSQLNHLKDFDTFFNTKKLYNFDEMLSKYFSSSNGNTGSNNSEYSSKTSYSGSSSSSYSSDESGDPLKKAVKLLVDNVNSQNAQAFDRDIENQFRTKLQSITSEFSKMTGYKWTSNFYISDTLTGLMRLPSQISRFLKRIPELAGSFHYDYYYPVDTLIDLTNTETKQVITIQTTYWFIIDKTNMGSRFKHGLGFRCYMNGQVSYEIDYRKFFYKFRSTEMITDPNPPRLRNIFSLITLLRLGLGEEGSEAHMMDTLIKYYTKQESSSKTSSTDSNKNNSQEKSQEYTKNSSTASGNPKDEDIGLYEQDVFFESLKKNAYNFDEDFSRFLNDGVKKIAVALTAKMKYRYSSLIYFAPKISDLVKTPELKKNLFANAYKSNGKLKVPLTLHAYGNFVTRDDGSEKRINAVIRFEFTLTENLLSSFLFGKACNVKVTIDLNEANTVYTYFKNYSNGNITLFNSLDEFLQISNKGDGRNVHVDELLEKKYSKASTESNSAQQSNAQSNTTGSNAKTGTGFKDYVELTDIANFVKTLNGYKLSKRTTAGVPYSSYALQVVAPKISPEEKKIIDKEKYSGELLKQARKLNSIRIIIDYNEKDKTVLFKRVEKIVLNGEYQEPSVISENLKGKAVQVSIALLNKLKTFFTSNAKATDLSAVASKFNALNI